MDFVSHFARIALVILVSFAGTAISRGDNETARIEAIKKVASLETATFIRNGREYSSEKAAKFLRAKWQAIQDGIRTASVLPRFAERR